MWPERNGCDIVHGKLPRIVDIAAYKAQHTNTCLSHMTKS